MNFKNSLKSIWVEFFWLLATITVRYTKAKKSDEVLVLPAANLDGGFGEDIMITSFIQNYAKGRPVTILTSQKIVRKDYLNLFNNITFVGGFNDKINFLNILKLIQKHSCVFVIGADIMDGTYGIRHSINRLRVLELANKLNIDAQITGFSVSKKILPDVKNKFIEIAPAVPIKLRDIESYKRMVEFIDKDKLILTNDVAFICPDIKESYANSTFESYKKWCIDARENGKQIIGVCPNSIQAKKVGLEKYLHDIKILLEEFNALGNYAMVFLYHDLRKLCGKETDSTLSKTLYKYFGEKGYQCFYTPDIQNGIELKGYLTLIDFTLTGRMHFGISGMTFNKPMFGISYANKFEGMIDLFNIKPDQCLVDYDKMTVSQKQIKNFVGSVDQLTKNVAEHIGSVQKNTLLNFTNA